MIKYFLKKLKALLCVSCIIFACVAFTACYSVFSGGTGGTVVDSESNSTPKAGIANVDVYAYTNSSDRDNDFSSWNNSKKTEAFKPNAEYYGHTTTGADGSWTISKLVWKEKPFKTDFGKDADFTVVYLIFYHADYGCTKDETIIVSDSASNYTYVELTSIVKRTNVTLNFVDVATASQTSQSVLAEVSVPQKTDSNPDAEDLIYSGVFTGTGTVTIRYPRYLNDSGTPTYTKTDKENVPQIKVNYYQAREGEAVTWKGCKQNIEENDFSFYADEIGRSKQGLTKTIEDSPYSITLAGKLVRFTMPSFSGTLGDTSSTESDGVHILLKGIDQEGNYTIDLGDTYTTTQNRGTNGEQTHGYFSGLGGTNYEWRDYTYNGRYSNYMVRFMTEDGTVIKDLAISNDKNEYVLTF